MYINFNKVYLIFKYCSIEFEWEEFMLKSFWKLPSLHTPITKLTEILLITSMISNIDCIIDFLSKAILYQSF